MSNTNTTTTGSSVTITSEITSTPVATLTSSVPVTSISSSSVIVSESPTTSISYVSQSPTSTVIVAPAPTTPTTVPVVSSTVVITPSSDGSLGQPTVVTITSTQDTVTVTPANTTPVSTPSSTSARPTQLGAAGASGQNGSGLSSSGKIAIAVVIPIVVIASLFLLGLFFWRRRKAKKSAEEQRKDEMAEYGFNPNNDPTLVPVGAAYTDGGSEGDDGYRGWGTTSSNPRKPSTTMGSNSRAPNGMAYSDTTSQPGNYNPQGSPNGRASEAWSGDPLVHGHPEGIDGVGALGGAAAAGGAAAGLASYNNRTNKDGLQRGPSNASSAYSHNPPHSETSSDTPGNIVNYYQEEVPYNIYNDVAPQHGPYGEGPYNAPGTDQPVIRDVQARRNTRIERVPTFPQTQGGIAQNF